MEDQPRSHRETSTAPIPSRSAVRDHGGQQLNPHAETYRPKGKAASVASAKIKDIEENEEKENENENELFCVIDFIELFQSP